MAFWELGEHAIPVASISASPTTIAENGGTRIGSCLAGRSCERDGNGQPRLQRIGHAQHRLLGFVKLDCDCVVGGTSGSVSITSIDDAIRDDDETITVGISDATGATIGGASSTSITIVNDDQPEGFPRSEMKMGF